MEENAISLKDCFKPYELAMLKRFIYFLKEKNALDNYIKDLGLHTTMFSLKKFILRRAADSRRILIIDMIVNIIDKSLYWNATPEGHWYWENLHSEWSIMARKLVKKYQNEGKIE